jgi:cob(I)alamin adenosyltransferase
MKIYTKTGDNGQTSLVGGTRISKGDPILDVYGTIDELNAFIGLIISEKNIPFLSEIQNDLFIIGGVVATEKENFEKYWNLNDLDLKINQMEIEIDQLSSQIPEKKFFTLPQGSKAIAYSHICRTICRKSERKLAPFIKENPYLQPCLKYVNRLSDYFYILARFFHKEDNVIEKPCVLRK